MKAATYAICAVLVAGSAAYAKHHKHEKTEVVQTERTEVSEPVQAGVGQEIVVNDAAPIPQDAAPAPMPGAATQAAPGEVRTEVHRTEVYTETKRCETCRPCKVKCGKADIEKLKGKACCTANGLQSTIRYKVETKHVAPGQLELVMHFSDHGRLLADEKGQPYTVVVSLDQPSDKDDDELKYTGSLPIPIPAGPWHDELRIEGQVVSRADGRVLDRDHGELELPD